MADSARPDEGVGPAAGALLRSVPAAVLIGVLSALTLVALSAVAEALQDLVWIDLPQAWSSGPVEEVPWWWTMSVLTATGLLVGATLKWVPGHAGPDPATTGLVAPALPLRALPGLALALVLALAGGVSLGPENPIIAVNVGLAVWLLSARGRSSARGAVAGSLATAGTIGALFATPVAAALVLTEAYANRTDPGEHLLDRLFAPLVAAGAGSVTMMVIGAPTFTVSVGSYEADAWDLVSAPAAAAAAALMVGLGALALPFLHRTFHSISSPVVALGAAGVCLGALGAVGGEVTLFKGLDQMKELAAEADQRTWIGLAAIALIKVAAMLIATASGFRGGRIFPAVFIGVAIGLAMHALIPEVPLSVSVAAAILGAVIAVDRDGWIALFMAAVVIRDIEIFPLLCLTLAAVWPLARLLPEFVLPARTDEAREFGIARQAHAA